MENILVDMLYYDHLLSRIVSMHREDAPLEDIMPYAALATQLNGVLRARSVKFDSELYVKEILVKTLLVIPSNERESKLPNLIDSVNIVKSEYEEILSDSRFIRIHDVIKMCLAYYNSSNMDELLKCCGLLDIRYSPSRFPLDELRDILNDIPLKSPGLVRYAAKLMRSSMNNKPSKKKISFLGNDPGERINWD